MGCARADSSFWRQGQPCTTSQSHNAVLLHSCTTQLERSRNPTLIHLQIELHIHVHVYTHIRVQLLVLVLAHMHIHTDTRLQHVHVRVFVFPMKMYLRESELFSV